jgi:hypothetical protein
MLSNFALNCNLRRFTAEMQALRESVDADTQGGAVRADPRFKHLIPHLLSTLETKI